MDKVLSVKLYSMVEEIKKKKECEIKGLLIGHETL